MFTFIWKIENYFRYLKSINEGENLRSPKFIVESLYNTQWYLELLFVNEENIKNYVCCRLRRSDESQKINEIIINCTIELLNKDDTGFIPFVSNPSTFKITDTNRSDFSLLKVEKQKLLAKMATCNEDALIIGCIMKNQNLISTCEAITKLNINWRYSTEWNVIKTTLARNSSFKHEKIISIPQLFPLKLTLTLSGRFVQIQITPTENIVNIPPQLVTCRITLFENVYGSKRCSETSSYFFHRNKNMDSWLFPDFIKVHQFVNSLYFKSTFTLLFEFESLSNEETIKVNAVLNYAASKSTLPFNVTKTVASSDKIATDIDVLQTDMQKLFIDKKYADVQLKIAEKTFLAHKFILSARSPVFNKMFESGMQECKTGIVNISDLDPNTMSNFLQYLYTGTTSNMDCQDAVSLLMVANRYEVHVLEDKCSSFLMTVLSTKNVCEILAIADLIRNKGLRACAIDYIIKHSSAVLNSTEWSSWVEQNIKLATEVFSQLAKLFTSSNAIPSQKS